MLDKIVNKNVKITVALYSSSMPRALYSSEYEGKVVAYDDNFLVFDDGTMINIRYIQIIQVI